MQIYTLITCQYFADSHNVGTFPSDTPGLLTGSAGTAASGNIAVLQLKVDSQQQIIEAKFKAYGSTAIIAACAWVTQWLQGRSLIDAQNIQHTDIMDALQLPAAKAHCALLVKDALQTAIDNSKATANPIGMLLPSPQ